MSSERPTYVLQLRSLPRVDPIRALRGVLKTLLRRHGMRCVSVNEIHSPQTEEEKGWKQSRGLTD